MHKLLSVPLFLGLVIAAPPKIELLVQAVRRGDPIEIDRIARRFGAARLRQILVSGANDARRAALAAAPRVEDAWTLLHAAIDLAGSGDEAIGTAAVTCARRIAAQLDHARIEAEEVPRDYVREASRRLVALAKRADL